MNRRVSTADFFTRHPIFSLDEAAAALTPTRGKGAAVERLKHHLGRGRLTLVTREIYAVVPPGVAAERHRPDPFLIAAAIRPEAVFAYHSALELLGAAHSVWHRVTVFAETRRRPLTLDGVTIQVLDHPKPLRAPGSHFVGTRKAERRGRILRVTGPERALVEGLRRPNLAGGPEELVVSAAGFPTLELELLERVLHIYDARRLWAATGWFLEAFQSRFHVPGAFLDRLEKARPASPQYLLRSRRSGTLAARWNLIVPEELSRYGMRHEP